MPEDHNSLRGLATAAGRILMGIAPFEKCLPVAKRNRVRVMELRTLVPVPYDDHLIPRAQVAPIVTDVEREVMHTFVGGPVLFCLTD